MRTFRKAAVEPGARTLDARWYLSGDVFAQEQQRIFSRAWICAGRSSQLPQPGSFIAPEIAGESLIIIRDAAGSAHAFYNVCRHRGTRLCTQPHGRFKGAIQCPYHAWTYGLDGALLTARNMESVPGFDRRSYPLHEAALVEASGFLFVALQPQTPFETQLEPFFEHVERWGLDRLRSAHRIRYEAACNWKLVFQNYSECYHCPVIHPQLERLSPWDSGRNDLMEGPILGGYMTLRDEHGSLTVGGVTVREPISTLEPHDRGRVYYYTIFPSLLLSLHPDYVMAHYIRPMSPNRTEIVCEWLFSASAMAREDFNPSDAVEFWDLTNRQDWNVSELTQLGLASRSYTPGPYAAGEGLLHAFDRHYLSVMAP